MVCSSSLIVMPLEVRGEFIRDAVSLLGMEPPQYIRHMGEAGEDGIYLTNYERVRDGDIDPGAFMATSLDEASVLRSFGSKTYQTFLKKFKGVPFKLVATANQTYRLGYTEQCKDGTKMGVGCPEYLLLFRKLPTDRSKAYADEPVARSKEDYSLARWQIDAAGFWRSSGDRRITPEEMAALPIGKITKVYKDSSRRTVYDFHSHLQTAEGLAEHGRLSKTFETVPAASWSPWVWDDVSRMRTLNTTQSQKRREMHVCPLQLDIVERVIERYSAPGDVVLDPFGGLMTVPEVAVKMGRYGWGVELNPDYFRDGVSYLESAEAQIGQPTLFDFMGGA